MPTKSLTFTAGETKRLDFAGEYFRILETTGPISADFFRRGVDLQEGAESLEAGFGLAVPGGGFDRINFYSASAQTIKVFFGSSRASYDRAAGSVAITSVVRVRSSDAGAKGSGSQSVGTSSTLIFNSSVNRPRVLVRSRASNTGKIWLHFGGAAAVNDAIELAPGEMWEEFEAGSALALYGISDVAAQTVDWHTVTT